MNPIADLERALQRQTTACKAALDQLDETALNLGRAYLAAGVDESCADFRVGYGEGRGRDQIQAYWPQDPVYLAGYAKGYDENGDGDSWDEPDPVDGVGILA